ncbi:hypothetical protein [Endozoicomonas arenosclerae]|uniref:hypothetical protein n=1 Tax=Endozoicomonas arenosclerae TaxID=1633495 RepID=UPI000782C106|nr:hypothetical protein [Endozoicomonas arenosclerae]
MDQELVEKLIKFEQGINIHDLESSKVSAKIIGAGSTTMGLKISSLPGKHVRRLPGFYTFEDAKKHIEHIEEYRQRLHALGIATTDTQLVALEAKRYTWGEWYSGGQGIVYVVQPFLEGKNLAKNYLDAANEEEVMTFFEKQLDIARTIIKYNQKHEKDKVGLDVVLNNWELHFTENGEYTLRFNDLAQPVYLVNGTQAYDFYDQASSIMQPFTRDTQAELQKQFQKLNDPRKFLMEMLWGYESINERLIASNESSSSTSLRASFNNESNNSQNCTPESNLTSDCHYTPYPFWAMEQVNQTLRELGLDELTGEEVHLAFRNNNYALYCFRLYRGLSARGRDAFSYLWLSNPLHIKHPDSVKIDMYEPEDSFSNWDYYNCWKNPETRYHPSPK